MLENNGDVGNDNGDVTIKMIVESENSLVHFCSDIEDGLKMDNPTQGFYNELSLCLENLSPIIIAAGVTFTTMAMTIPLA